MGSRFDTGFDRIRAAMNGVTDRVPSTPQMHEFVMIRTAQDSKLYYSDPYAFVSGLLRVTATS
jgi:hypothetical protein